jgi:hypothetical protein
LEQLLQDSRTKNFRLKKKKKKKDKKLILKELEIYLFIKKIIIKMHVEGWGAKRCVPKAMH